MEKIWLKNPLGVLTVNERLGYVLENYLNVCNRKCSLHADVSSHQLGTVFFFIYDCCEPVFVFRGGYFYLDLTPY